MKKIAVGAENHLEFKEHTTLGPYGYWCVPGCWADRYGSRAPEWRTKVSTF
jgi:hypothetical protein